MFPSNWRAVRCAMLLVALAALSVACSERSAPERAVPNRIEFGIWRPDANGDLQFEATDEVPYVAEQPFGWRLRSGAPSRPVKWVERLELPAPAESWEGVAESPNVTLSEDGRTATTFGAALPGDTFIGNVWYVSAGDPTGEWRLTIEFEDGRKASFRFRMVAPKDGSALEPPGEIV